MKVIPPLLTNRIYTSGAIYNLPAAMETEKEVGDIGAERIHLITYESVKKAIPESLSMDLRQGY